METTVEELINGFLTVGGMVFTSRQFDLPYEKETGDGGSAPDIIALDFNTTPNEVVVVEITVSGGLGTLNSRIVEREGRWYRPLRAALMKRGIIDDAWTMRTLAFVRQVHVVGANAKFADHPDVTFYAIEDAILPYSYWDSRMQNGLPRSE